MQAVTGVLLRLLSSGPMQGLQYRVLWLLLTLDTVGCSSPQPARPVIDQVLIQITAMMRAFWYHQQFTVFCDTILQFRPLFGNNNYSEPHDWQKVQLSLRDRTTLCKKLLFNLSALKWEYGLRIITANDILLWTVEQIIMFVITYGSTYKITNCKSNRASYFKIKYSTV